QFEWHLASALTDRGERTLATHDDLIYALSATPDGARVAVGLRLGCVEVYDVNPGTRVFAVPEAAGGTAHSVALSRDGEHLFLGSGDGRIHQWEVSTGRYLGEVGRHESAVLKLAVTAGGTLASASIGGEGALWDVRARAKLGGFEDQRGGV